MIIDTHSHCYWDTMMPRIDDIVVNMSQTGITKAVQIGCDIETSEQAIDLAQRFPGIFYATVGHHPETAQNQEIGDGQKEIEEFEKLVAENRDVVVAIGETGFDHHYLDGTAGGNVGIDMDALSDIAKQQIENQKRWWLAQWELAKRYDLPLVIHTRDARDATADFMIENGINRAVIHCYSEDPEFAQRLMDFSSEIYFAFGGILTYKKSEQVQATAQMLPLNRILLETDAPFLSPQAVRGSINEPANTRYVLEKLIELRSESAEEIERVVYENSLKFFRIK
ncbi:TatD family hydrolase [Candidatus Gracilibacteria bacterium]|nr:TatD family hydrolase [Candidatus Gracilibacteria bacterium]